MTETKAGDELGVAQRRRVTRQLIIGVPLVAAWWIFAAKGPTWLVDRAEKAMDECLDGAYKAHADPSGCRLGAGFQLARVFPEVRVHAREVERRELQHRAELVIDHVMDGKPTAARRDAAGAQLLIDGPDHAGSLYKLARVGVLAPLAAAAPADDLFDPHADPAFAALTLGDVAAARTAMSRGDRRGYDVVQAAALACLLGDRPRGLALLRTAAADRENHAGTPDGDVRVTAQHCGGTFDNVGFDPYVVPSFLDQEAAIARLYDPKVQDGRRASLGAALLRASTIFPSLRVGALALVANGRVDASPVALLQIIASPYVHDISFGAMFSDTPWPVVRSSYEGTVDYVPPAWLELAATRYAHAATLSPARLDRDADHVDVDAAAHPRELLNDAAQLVDEYEAGYWLRRGDRAGARRALEHWRALDPTDFRRAPLEVAAGDPAAALATVAAWKGAQHGEVDDAVKQVVGITLVFGLMATGKQTEAHSIATALVGSQGAWLSLATAIASGASLDGLLPAVQGKPDGLTAQAVLVAITTKQPIHEIVYLDPDQRAVLPAVMVAIAHAAQVAGEDPEVALDQAFSREMPSRTVALARAEAARWRKDSAAAERWDARAAAIEKLFVDDHAVVLAGVAGLW